VNIWLLDHYATPPDTAGSTRHFEFAREFMKQGHQVSILASGFSHRTRREERLERNEACRRENIDGVEFIWIKTSPYYGGNDWRRVINMLSYSFRVVPLGIRLKKGPDVILASSPHPFAGLSGFILAKLKKARFIFEVMDLWPQVLVDIGGYSKRNPIVQLLRILERFLYQRAKKIVVLMPNASEYITRLGIPDDKIVYIPLGANPELFSGTGVKMPQELDEIISSLKSKGKLLVGYTGAHGIHDALDTLIESAKLLQDEGADKVHFLLVGDGPEKERLVRKVESLELNNISFHKSIPKNAMRKLLKAIDIAVISRRKTGLYKYGVSSFKIWDYMICAKPVVWGIDSANNPVVEANCGISVAPENPDEMAKAIMELCDLSDKARQDMGKRGYEYGMKYHAVPVLASKLLKVLEN